jgi:hypothetical protein
MIDENLGFVFEATKGGRMHDTVTIALKFAASARRWLRDTAATAAGVSDGIRRQLTHDSMLQ